MKTNKEIRAEAWKIIRGKWFWRMLLAGALLNGIGQLVINILGRAYKGMGIQTYTDFLVSKAQALQGGLDLTVPSRSAGLHMMGASCFELFITYVFSAILAFGCASVALKAIRDEEHRWFADSFAGFRKPLELAWLMLVLNVRVTLWMCLFLIPGFIAIYRYRQAWYLKVENPDWSAGKCLAESGRLMHGHKAEAFTLDCSYIGWMILAATVFGVGFGLASAGNHLLDILGMIVVFGAMFLFVYLACYYFAARTVFYREVKRLGESATPANA